MPEEALINEVKGSEIRCSGTQGRPHDEITILVPPHETVDCPICGQRYRRISWWNAMSEAIWPRAK